MNNNTEMEYIEFRNYVLHMKNMPKIEILDFNSEYSAEEISMKSQDEINKIILNLRQKYYINKYKSVINYLKTYLENIYEDYDIFEVYGLNFNEIKFNTMRRGEYCEYIYKYNPDYDPGFFKPHTALYTRKEELDMKLNEGIMYFIGPTGYYSYVCNDGRKVYPLFRKHNFVENITNLYNELNFIKLIDTRTNNIKGIYFVSKFNPPYYFNLAKSVYKCKDIESELFFYNTNDRYYKMFTYNLKTKKVLYIIDKFNDDVEKIEFGKSLDDKTVQKLKADYEICLKDIEKMNKKSIENRLKSYNR